MSCLATLAAFVIICAAVVIYGLGQLCELGMYLLGELGTCLLEMLNG